MPKIGTAWLLAALIAFSGCTPVAGWTVYGLSDKGPNDDEKALLEKQSERYKRRGDSTISGRAFLVAADGRQIPASLEEVYLTPVTTWAEGKVVDVLASNEIPEGEARAAQIWWVSRADSEGRFAFRELVDGEYFVLCPIPFAEGSDTEERIAFARVKVGPNDTAAGIEVTRRIEE